MRRNTEIRNPNERVKALITEAGKLDVEIGIPIKIYFRAARNLLISMYSYLDDKDVESAYILATKFVILFLEKLPKHPGYKSIQSEEISKWNLEVKKTLKGAEKMKEMILDQYKTDEEERCKVEEKQKELDRLKELENKKLAEKKWLEDQENKLFRKEKGEIDNLENFLSGVNNDVPSVDRSLKPASNFGVTDQKSNNAYNWRTLEVPKSIFEKFLHFGKTNTLRNIETCGILCGKISGGKFVLTTVVIPKQSGTCDSCTTEYEEEIFDYVDQNGLVTLGWIHTHPTQTAFLSSVDLHTQLSYQIMLPEAVAIVCSPKYNQNLFFSLTPDYGLNFIKSCKHSGFHPHPSDIKLFEESPHICLTDSLINFHDLR